MTMQVMMRTVMYFTVRVDRSYEPYYSLREVLGWPPREDAGVGMACTPEETKYMQTLNVHHKLTEDRDCEK